MLEVYWQTLTANLDHNLKAADKEFGEYLKLWRDFHSPGKGLEGFETSAPKKVTACAGALSWYILDAPLQHTKRTSRTISKSVQLGDIVTLILGAPVPYVLRQ